MHLRLDHAAALIAYTVSMTIPRKRGHNAPKYADFLQRYEPAEPIDLETAMKEWR